MTEERNEGSGLWIIGVVALIVVGLVIKDYFSKPAPRAPTAPPTAAVGTPPASAPSASDIPEPPSYNPRAVMEDPEFADIAPKLPPGVKAPERITMTRNPKGQMQAALKALILSQEIYMADNGFTRYATRMDQLKDVPSIPEVRIVLNGAGPVGYTAVATHARGGDKKCALYVGTAPIRPAKVQGQIGCD